MPDEVGTGEAQFWTTEDTIFAVYPCMRSQGIILDQTSDGLDITPILQVIPKLFGCKLIDKGKNDVLSTSGMMENHIQWD